MGTMARANKTLTKAVAYLRTSSAANVGADKDSEKRQRAAIDAFAKVAGFELDTLTQLLSSNQTLRTLARLIPLRPYYSGRGVRC